MLAPPCVATPVPDTPPSEDLPSAPLSPQTPAPEPSEPPGVLEDQADGRAAAEPAAAAAAATAVAVVVVEAPPPPSSTAAEVPSSSASSSSSAFPVWLKSPERAPPAGPPGLTFSPVNSNLRDLTPSHTLEPLVSPFRPEAGVAAGGPVVVVPPVVGAPTAAPAAVVVVGAVAVPSAFVEAPGQLFYPGPEEQSGLAFSRSLSGEGALDPGGSALNPPQKKKVCQRPSSSDVEMSSSVGTSLVRQSRDFCELYIRLGLGAFRY